MASSCAVSLPEPEGVVMHARRGGRARSPCGHGDHTNDSVTVDLSAAAVERENTV